MSEPCTMAAHQSIDDCVWAMHSTHHRKLHQSPPGEPRGGRAHDDALDGPLANVPCLLLRIKKSIVRLRRGQWPVETWVLFRRDVETNIDYIITNVPLRWLVSILDTYVDHGEELERRNALLISLLVNWERLVKTVRREDGLPVAAGDPQGDSFHFNMTSDDTHINLFRRMHTCMIATPVIDRIFHTAIEQLLGWPGFTLARLNHNHENDLPAQVRHAIRHRATFL